MNTVAVLLLCVQACLVQNVYSNHCRSSGPAYGGCGIGNVAVNGELPVSGNTQICGLVPILGAVDFQGCVPASGCVSICGRCEGCGCGY